jgi:hypothetical protein
MLDTEQMNNDLYQLSPSACMYWERKKPNESAYNSAKI